MISFRPLLWPTLLSLPALVFMLGLGVWQLERRAWKNDLLERIQSRIAEAPVEFAIAVVDPVGNEYRRVRLAGEFLHDKEMRLAARSLRNRVGVQVVTPLLLDGGDVVLVNRGWVPQERRRPEDRAAGQVAGRVEIVGALRRGQTQGTFQPDNAPGRNVWFFVDVPAMRAQAGLPPRGALPHLDRVVVEADASPNPGGLPVGGQTRIDFPNDHLQYAITWFLLALGLAGVYLAYHRSVGRLRFGAAPSA